MIITKLVCHEVVVPAYEDRVHSPEYGPAIFGQGHKIIMEAHTDTQFIGLGESPRGVTEATTRACFSLLKDKPIESLCFAEPPLTDFSANDLFGHEHPHRPNRLWERSFTNYTEQGLHTIILDLMGKLTDQPLYNLMGGACRKHVAVDYWMGRMNPEDSAHVCLLAKDEGYCSVKCKCALEDDLVERAAAIAHACGTDFKITFDPNQRFYRYGEAAPMLKRLADVGNVQCVEDAFRKDDFDAYRMLRAQGWFPVAIHLGHGPMLIEAIRTQACDYVNLSDTPWHVKNAGAACWLAGLRTWHGSGIDLGITEAMMLHICAATKSMTLSSDIVGRMIRQHNIITNPLTAQNGTVAVPEGPGLGVALDRDALDKYTRRQFTIED
jgi:muconate cycloisomerase